MLVIIPFSNDEHEYYLILSPYTQNLPSKPALTEMSCREICHTAGRTSPLIHLHKLCPQTMVRVHLAQALFQNSLHSSQGRQNAERRRVVCDYVGGHNEGECGEVLAIDSEGVERKGVDNLGDGGCGLARGDGLRVGCWDGEERDGLGKGSVCGADGYGIVADGVDVSGGGEGCVEVENCG